MAVERAAGGTSLIDVLDRVLDKGIVIDAWVRVSLVGIDLITVEARIVVASIDTYLKYSEAVGQAAPVSKPAIEGKGYEEVVAENAALRAQLNSATARRTGGRGRPAAPAGKTNRPPPYTGVPRVRVAVGESAGDDGDLLASRVRLLEGLVGRSEIVDCAHIGLQWLGDVLGIRQSICLIRPEGELALFVVGRDGLGSAVTNYSVSLEDWRNPLVSAYTNRKELFFPAPHSAADRK